MNTENRIIRNAEGMRKIALSKLNYSLELLKKIKENPVLLDDIMNEMSLSDEDVERLLSGDRNINISYYDGAYKLVLEKEKLNEIRK